MRSYRCSAIEFRKQRANHQMFVQHSKCADANGSIYPVSGTRRSPQPRAAALYQLCERASRSPIRYPSDVDPSSPDGSVCAKHRPSPKENASLGEPAGG